MTIQELKDLMTSGQFHHATYRNFGTCWEGLWIYAKSDKLRGFEPVGCFNSYMKDPNLPEAEKLVSQTGYSVGSYGRG